MYHIITLNATLNIRAVITIPPQSVNVSLNEVVEFNCTGVANTFVWKVNEIEINNMEGFFIRQVTLAAEKSIRTSFMTMTVSSINATNITCTALKTSPLSNDESAPALMLVQGK